MKISVAGKKTSIVIGIVEIAACSCVPASTLKHLLKMLGLNAERKNAAHEGRMKDRWTNLEGFWPTLGCSSQAL
eukprot:3922-Heterococcus_DN1.PRE.1